MKPTKARSLSAQQFRLESRSSGVLLHPISLPGPYGIGDLGPEAYRFVDFLNRGKQRWWQMFPIGPTGFGNSPYHSLSVFAGNPLLISPDVLVTDKLLSAQELKNNLNNQSSVIDYQSVYRYKEGLFSKAFMRFSKTGLRSKAFKEFVAQNQSWLDDYALFRALKDSHEQAPWWQWPAGLRSREKWDPLESTCRHASLSIL